MAGGAGQPGGHGRPNGNQHCSGAAAVVEIDTPAERLGGPAVSRGRERLVLACGVVGPILFYAVFMVAGAVRPGYSAARQFVSGLSLGDQGWVQIANFIVFGLLTLAFAVGVRLALRTGPASVAGPLLLGMHGGAVLLGGVMVPDPPAAVTTVHGTVHVLAGIASLAAVAAACFVFARRFGAGRGFGLYSMATGLAIPILFVLTGPVGQPLGVMGVFNRVIIAVHCVWTVLLAMRLLRRPTTNHQPVGTDAF
jgi:hypothetical membrane protein